MALGGSAGDLYVDVRPDLTQFQSALDRGMREAFADVERLAEKAGEAVEDSFREAASQSEAHLDSIGGSDVWGEVAREAERTGEKIEGSFREAARQSERHLDGISASARSGLGGLGGMLAGLGIGAAVGAVATFGVQAAASLEMAQVGFEGLLGSADEAQAMMEQLTAYAASTPLELPGLADMTKNLMAQGAVFGVTQDNVLDYVTTIGDLTSVLGGGQAQMDAVTRALGQMGGLGRITAGDMNQIANALPGFNAWQAIADGMGLTVAEVRELSEQGKLAADEAIPLLLAGMQEFPGAAGAMERASKTLTGVLSTFKDTAQIALATGLAPLVESLKSGLTDPALLSSLSALGETFGTALSGLFDAVQPLIGPLLGALGTVLGDLGVAAVALVEAFSPLLPVVTEVATILSGYLADAFTTLSPYIAEIAGLLADVLLEALDALRPVLPVIVDALGSLAKEAAPILTAVLKALAPVLQAVGKVLSGTIAAVLPVITEAFGRMLTAIEPLIPVMGDSLLRIVNALAPVLVELAPSLVQMALVSVQLQQALAPLTVKLVELTAVLIEKLAPYLLKIAEALSWFSEGLLGVVQDVATFVSDVIGWFEDLFNTLVGNSIIPDLIEAIVDWFGRLPGMIVDALATLVSSVVGVFTGLASAVGSAVADLIGKVVAWWGEVPGKVVGALASLGSAIAGVFSAAWGAVSGAVAGLWSSLSGLLGGWASQVGSALSGIAGAISGVFSGAWGAVSGAIGGLIDKAVGLVAGLPARLVEGMGDIAGAVSSAARSAFRTGINTAIDGINAFLPNSIGWGPAAIDLPDNPIPRLPAFAVGGIVTSPTVGLLGESGPEVVVPLTRPQRAATLLAESGLASMLAGRPGAYGRSAAVVIERVDVSERVDVDLLWQKAGALVAVGRFG